jgi:hypothetical protein
LGAQRVTSSLGPYADYVLNADGLIQPAAVVSDSLLVLRTRSLDGSPVVATATAVSRQGDRTLLLTSYTAVAASTADPGPEVVVQRGDDLWTVEVVVWDTELDVAVLAVDADITVVGFASLSDLGVATGSAVFAVSASGVTATPGVVAAVNTSGIRHTASVDNDFAGGPVVDGFGKVLGFTVPGYRPGGVGGNAVPWAVTVVQVCEELLDCERASGN